METIFDRLEKGSKAREVQISVVQEVSRARREALSLTPTDIARITRRDGFSPLLFSVLPAGLALTLFLSACGESQRGGTGGGVPENPTGIAKIIEVPTPKPAEASPTPTKIENILMERNEIQRGHLIDQAGNTVGPILVIAVTKQDGSDAIYIYYVQKLSDGKRSPFNFIADLKSIEGKTFTATKPGEIWRVSGIREENSVTGTIENGKPGSKPSSIFTFQTTLVGKGKNDIELNLQRAKNEGYGLGVDENNITSLKSINVSAEMAIIKDVLP